MDYKQMYFRLFNRVTDAIDMLQEIQKESEELYLSIGEEQRRALLIKGPADDEPKG